MVSDMLIYYCLHVLLAKISQEIIKTISKPTDSFDYRTPFLYDSMVQFVILCTDLFFAIQCHQTVSDDEQIVKFISETRRLDIIVLILCI